MYDDISDDIVTRPYDFQDFKWLVHAEGYSWKSAARRRFLVPNPATGAPREYYPLRQDEEPRRLLFRMLVETELDEDAIQAFATTYGLLGIYDKPKSRATWATQGESLKAWEKEIRLMRQAVGLFDMDKRKDRKGSAQS